MDLSMRNELPKPGQDSRFLVDNQRHRADLIQKETEEYEQRAKFLKNKIKEIEDKIFNNQMGEKIKELVKENLNLSIDAQCLSIQLDIYNQGMDNRGVAGTNDASSYRNSPMHQGQGQPMMHLMGSPMSSLNAMNRSNTPTSSPNVVTLDTTSHPYAQVVPSPNMSPYPVQGPIGYPMNGGRTHLSPHHEPARQSISPIHQGQLYSYERQGSLSILNQVPPPAGMPWMQHQGNYSITQMSPSSSQMPPGPVVPPRPSDLPLRNRSNHRSGLHTPPHRPVPPPPTPPKPNSRSPNMERPRSSNDIVDSREELVNAKGWQCTHCTFENHEAINECEICGNSRQGSVATLNRSPH